MQNGPILLQQGEGKPPIQLTSAQVVNIIQQLQETNAKLAQQNAELQNALIQLQRIVQNLGNVPDEHKKTTTQLSVTELPVPNKLIPDKI